MRYAEVALHQIDWNLALEQRRVYGVTEVAGCLGVKPGTVRQWLFRAKTWFAWGYLEGMPDPDDRVGGRPVWLAQTVTWWIGIHLMAHLFGLRSDEENYVPGLQVDPEDPRYETGGRVLRTDAPLGAGRYVVRRARKVVVPPLVVAVAVNAAEGEMAGQSARIWRNSLRSIETREPAAGLPVTKAAASIRRDFSELWPWSD